MTATGTLKGPILVVGCGSIGSRHLRNLAGIGIGPLLTYDSDPERSRRAAASVGGTAIETIAQAPDLGAAFICTPTSRHLEPARAALERGAHLFIEKPIADSLEGVPALLEQAKATGRTIMVGFHLRFHPCLRRIKALLDEGIVGKTLGARIEFGQHLPDWHPWEDYRKGYSANKTLGGGIVLDAVHEFDYARWLLGEVRAVSGMTGTVGNLSIDTEDLAVFTLRHDGGAISELHLDYLQRVYARTCKVIGSDGTVYWDWHAKSVRCYRAEDKAWQEFPEPKGYDTNEAYLEEVRTFLAAVAGETPVPVDGAAGARILEVALAAKQAANTGRTVQL
jgi:predicted dehydrogenase